MNVIPAWLAGYSGKGVLITIIDDGLDHKHPELSDRYVRKAHLLLILHVFDCSHSGRNQI